MKPKFLFNIESLLYGIENPKGAIAQVQFAQNLAEHEGMPRFNLLAKVTFDDPAINKALPGAYPMDETLLIGYEGWNECVLHLCIRSGRSTCKIATVHFPNREVSIHEQYRHALILRTLSDSEIKAVFEHAWNNMEAVRPKDEYLDD